MLDGRKIVERAKCLSVERRVSIPAKSKDAFRKIGDRGTLPSLPTLIECAAALDTTVAYLIGETDDPSSIPRRAPLAQTQLTLLDAVRVGVTPKGRVLVEMPTNQGMVEVLMTGPQALHASKYLYQAEGELPARPSALLSS